MTTNKTKSNNPAKNISTTKEPDTTKGKQLKKNTDDKNISPVKEIDPNQYVVVRNGFQGQLVYKSTKTGEKFFWNEYGAEQEMELRELRNARNTCKKFFINNWFMFDEDWIVDYLGMRQYYKNAIKIEDFDDIFYKTPEEISEIISSMPEGQKRSAAYRARQLINDGDVDSKKAIAALEKSLGVTLVED